VPYLGELAALFTSLCWALSAVGFTNATHSFGSQVTNRVRVVLALLALLVINTFLYRNLIPFDAGSSRWMWLTLSGIVGLALGDGFLFSAYKHIGPRLGLLVLSLAPVFGTAIAWVFLGETLNLLQIAGILVTLGGISYVVTVRPGENGPIDRSLAKGVLFGVLAAMGQAVGLVLSRLGMTGNFPPFAGSLIRMLAAALLLWLVAALQGEAGASVKSVRSHPEGLRWALFGALFGPVIGVSASLLSIQHAEVGVASTLMALPPLFMLPISYFALKEQVTWRSIAGTLVAIAGVALLFLG